VQQPLQNSLVTLEPMAAMACSDVPVGGPCRTQATVAGLDAHPWVMSLVDHTLIVQEISNTLVNFHNDQPQDNLWLDNPIPALSANAYFKAQPWYYGHSSGGQKRFPGTSYFVSSLPNGTDTGVLREHALRLNSTLTCHNITKSAYPTQCPGIRPLDVQIHRSTINASICVPGQVGKYPWSLSRSRQDMEEEIFIDFAYEPPPLIGLAPNFRDFTMRCTAATSRGYFELGNIMNEHVYGPLLDEWPTADYIEMHTNDYAVGASRPGEM